MPTGIIRNKFLKGKRKMKTTVKSIFRIITLCLFIAAGLSSLAAQDVERGLTVEDSNANVAVFPQVGHTGGVLSVVFSPDGKYIISGSGDNTIKLWDVASGREIRTFSGHKGSVYSVAISPDGKYILSGSVFKSILHEQKLWDVASGQEIRTLEGGYCVAFSPDGKQALLGVSLYDFASDKNIKSFSGHTDDVNSVAFSPNGKQVLSGSNDKTVKLWDVASGKEIRTFSGHTHWVTSVAFSPDGKQVLSGSYDKTVKLWDVASGREIRTFSGHTNNITSVAFSPDGKQVLSSSWDKTVKLWDTASGREIRTFSGHINIVYSVAFSPDGKQILSGSNDRTIKLWDASSGQLIRTFSGNSKSGVNSIAISLDGRQILSGYGDDTVKLWDTASGQFIRSFKIKGYTNMETAIAFSPDRKQVLFSSWDYNQTTKQWNHAVKLYDITSGKEIKTFWGHTERIVSVAFSSDGKQVLSGSYDKTVKLWDIASGQEIKTFSGHTDSIRSVTLSPDGKQMLSSSWDYTMKLWDVASGQVIKTFSSNNIFSDFLSVAFSPDGKQILSGMTGGSIRQWDASSGKQIRGFSVGRDNVTQVNSVAFSPDGKQILAGSDDNIVNLFDAESGQLIKSFKGHSNQVKSVAFNPDGKRIISGSYDTTIRIWDIATGKEIACFITFSGGDAQIASASRGLTVETVTAATSNEGEWLSITPDGFYQASPRGDRYLNVRVENSVSGIDVYRSVLYNPDVVQARLQGKQDPASKSNVTIQDAANFAPPEVTIQSPANFSATNSKTANLSVNITSKTQPVKNIKIIVNGRLIGKKELAAVKGANLEAQKASLTVTGNQNTVNLSLPLELDPGNNRIEVVAFNGYSENRRYIDVTRNAPAGEKPALPNLWIVAVGVNAYSNAGAKLGGLTSLNYAVADAKGLVDSLKAQEGKRYGKVNVMLIADGEKLAPTTANIKKGLKFLESADPRRDIVILFLAGHGISAQEGKFFFLPKDAIFKGDKIVDATKAISGDEIMTVLDAPGNRLVFIDACQSGGVDNDRMVRSLMDTNAFVFTASRGNELSYESKELGHGFFTYSVMSALKGAPAALARGSVSVLSMSGFVKDDVPKKTGGRQNPSAYSLGFYDFPVAVIK